MKTLWCRSASVAFAVTTGAVCFGQNHLVSNADGAARVTKSSVDQSLGAVSQPQQCEVVSDQRTGSSTVYKGAGTKQSLSIAIPPSGPNNKSMPTGTPTGTTFNSSQRDFLLARTNQPYSSFPRLKQVSESPRPEREPKAFHRKSFSARRLSL
jgi:hypothetical protein